MRKIITSSVLILLFSLFSGQAFAGKVEACELIKHDPAYKGLYGLCNAYWNADENAQEVILSKFKKKADPDICMPGTPECIETVCPCWVEGEIDLGDVGVYCQVLADFAIAVYDGGSVQYAIGGVGTRNSCEYFNQNSGVQDFIFIPNETQPELTDKELAVCAAELLPRIENDFETCL